MRISKKFISALLASSVIFSSSIFNTSNVNASMVSYTGEDILDVISLGEYESIKKINIDINGNIESIDDVDGKYTKTSLEDGLYVIDRKDGWIRGRDAGVLRSIIIPSGSQGGLQQISYSDVVTSTTKNLTQTFGPEFIKLSVSSAYGEATGKGTEITVKNFITAENGNDIFMKAQTIYRKYEVVRIKNGEVIDHGTEYKPTTYATTKIEFPSGSTVDQKQLYESVDRNILGDSGYDIQEIIESNFDKRYEYNFEAKDNVYALMNFIPQENSIGVFFTIPRTGKYEIRDHFVPIGAVTPRLGVGASMTLYKVKKENNKIIETIASKPCNFVGYESYVGYVGEPLTADLKSDEKYLLVVNPTRDRYWPDKNYQKLNYGLQFKKVS